MEWLETWMPALATLDWLVPSLLTGPVVLLGIPVILAMVRVPARLCIADVPADALTERQRYWAEARDAELAALNYSPTRTIVVENLPTQNLNRVYQSSVEPAAILASVMRSDMLDTTASGEYFEVNTEFRDGTIVSTRSSTAKDLFDTPPGVAQYTHDGISDPVRLKRLHDGHSEPHRVREALHRKPDELEERMQSMHERWLSHQEARGLIRRRDGETYGATLRLALRGIGSFFNPFGDGFSVLRLAAAVLAGLAVPAFAISLVLPLGLVPSVAVEQFGLTVSADHAALLTMAPLLLAGSAAAGWILDQKGILWGLLFTYLCARWFLPEVGDGALRAGWLVTLVTGALVCGSMTNLRHRRRSVL